MAGTTTTKDHGEVLTKFEEIFGTLVEHEVIKLILQSCDWNATAATDTLLAMIDKNDLPPHTLSALKAESIVRSVFEGRSNKNNSGSSSGGGSTHNYPVTSSPSRRFYDGGTQETNGKVKVDNNGERFGSPRRNDKNNSGSGGGGGGTTHNYPVTSSPSRRFYDGGTQETNGKVKVDNNGERFASPSRNFPVQGVLETSEETTPSPSFSPLKHAPSGSDAVGCWEARSSRWVLAPEFMPNALPVHINSQASGSDVKSGIWSRALSSSLYGVAKNNYSPQQTKSQQTGTGKSKVSKNDLVRDKIQMGKKLMVIMRGLPGSGKTTMAKRLKGRTGVILSTDDFFCDKQGNYTYDSSRIGAAHEWNKRRTIQRLQEDRSPVIIDNTNLQVWEMLPYVKLAVQYSYEVELLEVDTSWKLNPKELAWKNMHGVPKDKITEMKQRYQQDVKVETLIRAIQQSPGWKDKQKNGILEKQNMNDDQNYMSDDELIVKDERDQLYEKKQNHTFDEKLNNTYDTTSDKQNYACDEKMNDVQACILEDEKNKMPGENMPSPLEQIKNNYENVDGRNCTVDEDEEDVDVIIEGYEDDGNVDILCDGAGEGTEVCTNNEFIVLEVTKNLEKNTGMINSNSESNHTFMTDICATEASVHEFSAEDNIQILNSNVESTHSIERKTENCNDGNDNSDSDLKELQEKFDDKLIIKKESSEVYQDLLTSVEILTAEDVESIDSKIQRLIEEANQETDISLNESEWENSITQPTKGHVTEEKFVDLVSSLSSALRQKVQEKEAPLDMSISMGSVTSAASDTYNEDSAMYEFCRNMEEKTGKSLSTYLAIMGGEKVDIPYFDDQSQDSDVVDMEERSFSILELPNTPPSTNDDTKAINLLEALMTPSKIKERDENTLKEISHDLTLEDHLTEANVSTNDSQTLGTVLCEERNNAVIHTHESEAGVDSKSRIVSDFLDSSSCSTDKSNPSSVYTGDVTNMECKNVNGNQNAVKLNETHSVLSTPVSTESMTSWECVEIKTDMSPASWDNDAEKKEKDQDSKFPKPSRVTGRRARSSGDPLKWMKVEMKESAGDPSVSSWNPVEDSPAPSWDPSQSVNISEGNEEALQDDPQPHTGAVSKFRRRRHNRTNSGASSRQPDEASAIPVGAQCKSSQRGSPSSDMVLPVVLKDTETQTLSIDFEALHLDNNLYELRVIYGKPNYIPKLTCPTTTGPLTTGKLRLEKGTMTDGMDIIVVKPFKNLVAFFPNIPEENLHDVYEKCKYDLDWAMNVLLDSGYEMSDPAEPALIQDGSESQEIPVEAISTPETTSTSESRNDQSFADTSDFSDTIIEKRKKKVKQSQQPQNLAVKKHLEECISLSDSVDDHLLRLTGKNKEELNMKKVKKTKKKNASAKNTTSPKNEKSLEKSSEGEGGAQYITLVMDPLFASQLSRMFGPVGSSEFGGELTYEDRNVILPLEFCHTIHQYWKMTLEGKFQHEAEVLDSLIRDDESLARRLQEEENSASGANLSNSTSCNEEGFHLDPPTQLQEIMDLEQALQLSKSEQQEGEGSLSSRLNLQRLCAEYPHVDQVALREEFGRNCHNYEATVASLTQRFGSEQGVPKTVIAPEALYRYEKQMVEQVQRTSLAQQQKEEEQDAEMDSEEFLPDDPQVYRDEAQLHYYQRQEAYKKAQDASQQGMKAVAAYYARIGNLHAAKLGEANQRASQKILEATNANHQDANCLDLHLLHVPEAMRATQAFLSERMRVLTARGMKQMEVSLITGRGAHSLGGQAKLKPAIKDFLRRSGYTFYEANAGMFIVTLRA
ncbi:hypothetical protein Pcinc_010233 [Petrolisthes cinctipes]|uniref:Smr domain-containing protein n=1 Tax=Petrolisthes cinctipes TaxID=88211 RepID=A0AAE1G3H0_PETCI|nr:hypothetical protein Pcinc_010233 [Petrolisthes cinctipes]